MQAGRLALQSRSVHTLAFGICPGRRFPRDGAYVARPVQSQMEMNGRVGAVSVWAEAWNEGDASLELSGCEGRILNLKRDWSRCPQPGSLGCPMSPVALASLIQARGQHTAPRGRIAARAPSMRRYGRGGRRRQGRPARWLRGGILRGTREEAFRGGGLAGRSGVPRPNVSATATIARPQGLPGTGGEFGGLSSRRPGGAHRGTRNGHETGTVGSVSRSAEPSGDAALAPRGLFRGGLTLVDFPRESAGYGPGPPFGRGFRTGVAQPDRRRHLLGSARQQECGSRGPAGMRGGFRIGSGAGSCARLRARAQVGPAFIRPTGFDVIQAVFEARVVSVGEILPGGRFVVAGVIRISGMHAPAVEDHEYRQRKEREGPLRGRGREFSVRLGGTCCDTGDKAPE